HVDDGPLVLPALSSIVLVFLFCLRLRIFHSRNSQNSLMNLRLFTRLVYNTRMSLGQRWMRIRSVFGHRWGLPVIRLAGRGVCTAAQTGAYCQYKTIICPS